MIERTDSTGPTLISGGRVIDPANGTDAVADVLIGDGVVREVANSIPAEAVGEHGRVIDATGLVVAPGFIDIHAHLREPGYEYKETIVTGAAAAARAGSPPSAPCPTPTRPWTTRRWWNWSTVAPPMRRYGSGSSDA